MASPAFNMAVAAAGLPGRMDAINLSPVPMMVVSTAFRIQECFYPFIQVVEPDYYMCVLYAAIVIREYFFLDNAREDGYMRFTVDDMEMFYTLHALYTRSGQMGPDSPTHPAAVLFTAVGPRKDVRCALESGIVRKDVSVSAYLKFIPGVRSLPGGGGEIRMRIVYCSARDQGTRRKNNMSAIVRKRTDKCVRANTASLNRRDEDVLMDALQSELSVPAILDLEDIGASSEEGGLDSNSMDIGEVVALALPPPPPPQELPEVAHPLTRPRAPLEIREADVVQLGLCGSPLGGLQMNEGKFMAALHDNSLKRLSITQTVTRVTTTTTAHLDLDRLFPDD